MTTKEVKSQVLDLLNEGGIRNNDTFRRGVPLVVELGDRIASLQMHVKELRQLATQLSDQASDYADSHAKALDTRREDRNELHIGLVTIDGKTYRYTDGWDGLKRTSGDNMTESFLQGLPATWTRSKLTLSVDAIGALSVSDDDLLAKGLAWKRKRTWCAERNT